MYYCFGCGKGGSIYKFLDEFEKLTFPEAVQRLAERAGIPLPKIHNDEQEISETEETV